MFTSTFIQDVKLWVIAIGLLLIVCVSAETAAASITQIMQYDPVTITNEAQLKGDGIAARQPHVMDAALIAELKAAPFSIINEALLKGDGIYRQHYIMDTELIEALKAAPFSTINEALLKGDGIYTER